MPHCIPIVTQQVRLCDQCPGERLCCCVPTFGILVNGFPEEDAMVFWNNGWLAAPEKQAHAKDVSR